MLFKVNVKTLITVGVLFVISPFLNAQTFDFEMLSSSKPTNLRGLYALDSLNVWTCGSNGYIGKSTNGGKTWEWVNPITYETSDFRDVHVFDKNTAIVVAAGTPALILRTIDGGKTWLEAFRSDNKEVFLDAIDFWDNTRGVCIGDFVNQVPYNLETKDGGKTWCLQNQDKADENGAYFAASGTCLRAYEFEGDTGFLAVSKVGKANILIEFSQLRNGEFDIDAYEIPYASIQESEGLFSLCIDLENEIVFVVGGDYAKPTIGFSAVYSYDEDEFVLTKTQVSGYRSCAEVFKYNNTNMIIACGPTGADVCESDSENSTWRNICQLPLNTVKKAKNDNTVFLCGKQGTIYKMVVK